MLAWQPELLTIPLMVIKSKKRLRMYAKYTEGKSLANSYNGFSPLVIFRALDLFY